MQKNWKKLRNMKFTVIPIVIEALDTSTGGLESKRTSKEHLNYIIIKIGQNIAKSPDDLQRLFVTHTPVEEHRLKLV